MFDGRVSVRDHGEVRQEGGKTLDQTGAIFSALSSYQVEYDGRDSGEGAGQAVGAWMVEARCTGDVDA